MDDVTGRLLAEGWEKQELKGFLDHVGPLWCRMDGETISEGLMVAAHHLNPRGTVHGGLLATLIDRCYGHTIRVTMPGMGFATIDLGVHFLGAAREGEFLEARAEIERQGRDLVFMSARIDCGERAVARSSAIFKLLPGVHPDAHSQERVEA